MRRRHVNVEMMICPYNNKHVVNSTRFQSHLIKCEQMYPPLSICPFNASHRMDPLTMEKHVKICDSKMIQNNAYFDRDSGRVDKIDFAIVNNTEECWD